MVHKNLVTRSGYLALEKHQVKMVTGYSSPGLQIGVALWPHCPQRLVEGWKVEEGAGMDQCGHPKKESGHDTQF